MGLNSNFSSASTSGNNVTIPGIDQAVNYKETQSIVYVGPSFVGRNESDKFLLIIHVGVGPLFFNVDMNYKGQSITGNKTTVGVNAGIAGEYKVNNKTGVGLKLSYVMGSIPYRNKRQSKVDMNINGIELDSYDPRRGIHAGFMTEYMFGTHLGLHAELMYFNSGANINPEQFKQWFYVSEDVSSTRNLNKHTFQLPLYLKSKFALSHTVKIYLMGGVLPHIR